MRMPRTWRGAVVAGAAVASIAAVAMSGGESQAAKETIPRDIARIYIEFNETANDLGFHVFVDGEDWKKLQIFNPKKRKGPTPLA